MRFFFSPKIQNNKGRARVQRVSAPSYHLFLARLTSTSIMDTSMTDELASIPHFQQPLLPPAGKQSVAAVAVASENAASKPSKSKKPSEQPSNEQFTKHDIENMLDWLELPANISSISNTTSGRGYATLAQVISSQSKGRLSLDAKSMRERFDSHRKTYDAVKDLSRSTDFGVTEKDNKNGIYTLPHKLESMCAC